MVTRPWEQTADPAEGRPARKPPRRLVYNYYTGPHLPNSPPYWEAPWPFRYVEDRDGTTRKANPDAPQGVHIQLFLQTLLAIPPDGRLITKDYLLDSGISTALNAYNLRIPEREQRVWAYFHWRRAQSCLDVPAAPGPGFDWTNTAAQASSSTLSQAITRQSFQLYREHTAPWPSVINLPFRWVPNGRKYRLWCYIHRHEKPAGGKYYDIVYSMSVWDRENDQISWHDPWGHQNHAARWADVQALWANAAPGHLQNRPIVAVPYTSLGNLQTTTHRRMKPKFSQIACVALGVWLMNHLDEPAPLRPPDRGEVLTGMTGTQFADLAVVLFQTLRESNNQQVEDIGMHGSSHSTRQWVRQAYRVNNDNARMRRQLRKALKIKFTHNPNLRSRGQWILDAMVPPLP
ncbi:hypothetical protein PG993_011555 [Apiospora rasikravindrae]|uniref:Transposase n=1 Tax=Apiospora rasikravindrae TaxID=990691 RepID=A0ABR1SEK5_9PEZI